MTDELKQAAEEYAPELPSYNAGGLYIPPTSNQDLRDAFIAGAEWRKKQMMKEAEECELYWDGVFLTIDLNMTALGYSEGDKVRIIIVKE